MDAIASLWMQLWSDTQTLHQALTILIFLVTIIFFLIGKIRSDIVALGCMAALMLCGIVTPKAALSGFANTAVIIMVFLFVVGGAIFQTGLAKYIAGRFLRLAGPTRKTSFCRDVRHRSRSGLRQQYGYRRHAPTYRPRHGQNGRRKSLPA